jgi:transposase InsO family protein
MEIWT